MSQVTREDLQKPKKCTAECPFANVLFIPGGWDDECNYEIECQLDKAIRPPHSVCTVHLG